MIRSQAYQLNSRLQRQQEGPAGERMESVPLRPPGNYFFQGHWVYFFHRHVYSHVFLSPSLSRLFHVSHASTMPSIFASCYQDQAAGRSRAPEWPGNPGNQ